MSDLARNADTIAKNIEPLLNKDRKVDLGGGAVAYSAPPFGRRLAVLISITDRFRRPSLLALIGPLADRLFGEWLREKTTDINDGVEVLRAIDQATWSPLSKLTDIRRACRDALIAEATSGCRSDELRELLSVLDLSDESDGQVVGALRAAFEQYRCQIFKSELAECRSREQFDSLLEDLETFKSELSIDTDEELGETLEAKAEFEREADDYADQMQDEWKERWRFERASHETIRDMFGSLKSD